MTTDDGSYGFHGIGNRAVVEELVNEQESIMTHCVAIGPMIMMKFVCRFHKET